MAYSISMSHTIRRVSRLSLTLFLSLLSPCSTLSSDCTKFSSEFAPNHSASEWRNENKCFCIEYCLPLARYQPLIRVNKRMRQPTIPPLRSTLHSICLPLGMFSIYLFLRAVSVLGFVVVFFSGNLNGFARIQCSGKHSLRVFRLFVRVSIFHFCFDFFFTSHCWRLCIPLFGTRKMLFIPMKNVRIACSTNEYDERWIWRSGVTEEC